MTWLLFMCHLLLSALILSTIWKLSTVLTVTHASFAVAGMLRFHIKLSIHPPYPNKIQVKYFKINKGKTFIFLLCVGKICNNWCAILVYTSLDLLNILWTWDFRGAFEQTLCSLKVISQAKRLPRHDLWVESGRGPTMVKV